MSVGYIVNPADALRKGGDGIVLQMNDRDFELFRSFVMEHTGIWLRDGKQVMLASRLSRRLRHHGLRSFSEYYKLLQSPAGQSDEIRELINCVTTNKTSFFREAHHFEFLEGTALPEALSKHAGSSQRIRIWSAASSTGEEPYSIAITLFDALAKRRGWLQTGKESNAVYPVANTIRSNFEVIASDIDTSVLQKARMGVYGADTVGALNEAMLKRHFLRGRNEMNGYVKVKTHLAQAVDFLHLNLNDKHWPIEGKFDVIFFRNALIYFKQETQDIFLRRMATYLKPGGYLFLGSSEHIPWLSDIYQPLNRTMYKKRGAE